MHEPVVHAPIQHTPELGYAEEICPISGKVISSGGPVDLAPEVSDGYEVCPISGKVISPAAPVEHAPEVGYAEEICPISGKVISSSGPQADTGCGLNASENHHLNGDITEGPVAYEPALEITHDSFIEGPVIVGEETGLPLDEIFSDQPEIFDIDIGHGTEEKTCNGGLHDDDIFGFADPVAEKECPLAKA